MPGVTAHSLPLSAHYLALCIQMSINAIQLLKMALMVMQIRSSNGMLKSVSSVNSSWHRFNSLPVTLSEVLSPATLLIIYDHPDIFGDRATIM